MVRWPGNRHGEISGLEIPMQIRHVCKSCGKLLAVCEHSNYAVGERTRLLTQSRRRRRLGWVLPIAAGAGGSSARSIRTPHAREARFCWDWPDSGYLTRSRSSPVRPATATVQHERLWRRRIGCVYTSLLARHPVGRLGALLLVRDGAKTPPARSSHNG